MIEVLRARVSQLLLVAAIATAGAAPALSDDYIPMTRGEALEALASAGDGERPDLRNRDFRGQDLSGVDFKRADLFGTHFRGVPLRNAKLAGTNLDISILREADLEKADLRDASLFGVVLVDANLQGADLTGARLIADLQRANLDRATLVEGRFGADMKNQPMGKLSTRMVKVTLHGADLSRVDLSGCDARFAEFIDAILTDADLSRCDLRNADFSGADMTRTRLAGALLDGAKFHDIEGRDTLVGLDSATGVEAADFGQDADDTGS